MYNAHTCILGHWNSDGDGCASDATVPAVYEQLSNLPACRAVKNKMKYFMGHTHCNHVTQTDIGYMIGGVGMSDRSCAPVFGFSVIDTTNNAVNVYYFGVQQINPSFDHYEDILNCIQKSGVSGCYHLATQWSFQQLPML